LKKPGIGNRQSAIGVVLVLAVALAVGCGGARSGPGSVVPATTGTVYLPDGYDSGRRYPVLVMLPASNGTAVAMRRSYPQTGPVIVLLAAGTGTPADYATNSSWAGTIARYERQLRADVAALVASGHADPGRVYLAGFSMGGDLAWALTLRNPELVKGAIVMGSRMSYRSNAADHAALKSRHVRFYLIMGEDEDAGRFRGVEAARSLLDSLDVSYRYRRVSDLGHLRAPANVFADALEFVLD